MSDTKTKILDLAERYTQLKGFNGFSYLDLASDIGIKAASIHYHFKSKDDLAFALVERTHESHKLAFHNMNLDIAQPEDRLSAIVEYFKKYIHEDRFCLCGMMSAELQSISPRVKKQLDKYFTDFQMWLTEQFKALGYQEPSVQALKYLSMLEGALLIARLRNDPEIVESVLKVT